MSSSTIDPTEAAWRVMVTAVGVGLDVRPIGDLERAIAVDRPDWRRVRELTARHRVVGLVGAVIGSSSAQVPKQVRTVLSRGSKQNRLRVLGQIGELARIASRLEAAGVPYLAVKGPTAAIQAWPDPQKRRMVDLDLYVPPHCLREVEVVLTESGYARHNDRLPDTMALADMESFVRHESEVPYLDRRGENSNTVDLHWKPFGNPCLYPLSVTEMIGRADVVRIGQHGVATLSVEDHFIYICVHGAKHDWMRVQWLTDVVAFTMLDRLDWTYLTQASDELEIAGPPQRWDAPNRRWVSRLAAEIPSYAKRRLRRIRSKTRSGIDVDRSDELTASSDRRTTS